MHRALTRPGVRVAVVVLASLSAANCSGGENADDEDHGRSAEVRAASINLQLTDLPEGYVAIPASDGENQEPLQDCPGIFEDDEVVADASSPGFSLQTDASLRFVTSRTVVLSGTGPSQRALASIRAPGVLACLSERFGEAFARILPQAAPVTALALVPDPALPELGGASVGLGGAATFTSEGDTAPITLTTSIIFIQTEDAVSVLLFGGVLEPFPSDIITALATTVADRQSA